MLSYEVTIQLDDPTLALALEEYMTGRHVAEVVATCRHVAEVVATGYFVDGRFERSEPGVYRSRYTVRKQEDLDRYVEEHAPRLRADFLEHFPAGVRLARAVWTELT